MRLRRFVKRDSAVTKLSRASLSAEINVTPLVDVCLVLLIIFMVVTPLLQKGVPVNLPVTRGPEKTPETERELLISVKSNGTVYLERLVVREEQLDSELQKLYERGPDREVAVKGDRRVDYGKVARVLRACRDVGFTNVGLIAQAEKAPGAGG
jgi:biopolymer transport protein ExbD